MLSKTRVRRLFTQDGRLRGEGLYRFTLYDGAGRPCVEGTSLSSDPNRYTERVLEYTPNGNIRRFQRHGLKDDGVYGKIDNLHLSYEGNQLKSVLDDALDVTRYASSDFPDLADKSDEYTYDACGAPTSDLNLGITSISYDLFGHPRRMKFASGEEVLTVYTPDGRKMREIRKEVRAVTPSFGSGDISLGQLVSDTIDYVGPVTYEGARPVRLRYAGGYASLIATASKVGSSASAYTPTFYFYVTDYQGNNRGVLNASSGTLDQITHYYPWGSPYADLGKSPDFQPYKYSDKELSTFAGVSRYDFSARTLFPAIPRFDRPDPLSLKYPHISPYAFCANNPVNATDPDGNVVIFINGFDTGDGGSSAYWEGIDRIFMQIFNDQKALYIDGSPGSAWSLNFGKNSFESRTKSGYQNGKQMAEGIFSGLEDGETIKFVTHSMGAAYAKGFINGMKDFAGNNEIGQTSRIELEVDLAPYQPNKQSVIDGVPTVSISHTGDFVAGTKPMKGAINLKTEVSHRGAHSITSFSAKEISKAIQRLFYHPFKPKVE